MLGLTIIGGIEVWLYDKEERVSPNYNHPTQHIEQNNIIFPQYEVNGQSSDSEFDYL